MDASHPVSALWVLASSQAPVPVKEDVLENLKSPGSIASISDTEALISEKGGNLLRVNLTNKTKAIITGFPYDLANDERRAD